MDISEQMIEIARQRGLQDNVAAAFVVGDMETLDLGQCDFDGVLFFDCLHHCPGYAEALKRAYAHLRPGGCVMLLETTWLHRYSPHAREATRQFGVTEWALPGGSCGGRCGRRGFGTYASTMIPVPATGVPGAS